MKHLRNGLIIPLYLICVPLLGQPAQSMPQPADNESSYTLYNISTWASASSGGQTPFWMTGNRHGLVPLKANNGYLQTQFFHHQPIGKKGSLHTGLDVVAAAPRYRNVYVQQLFAAFSYGGWSLNIGSRNGADYNASLMDPSLSSGDMTLSSNARPIPEINFYTPQFMPLPYTNGWIRFKGNFAVGRSFDTDYLNSFLRTRQDYNQNTRWHHKSLYVRIKDAADNFPLSVTVGLRHAAQWGGRSTNPSIGVQPHSLKDFIRIITGQSGGNDATESDQINVLGNHYGTYDVQLGYKHANAALCVYYQHFFDDVSGMEFQNALDGLMGVRLDLSACRWLKKILLERLNTLNQSGPFHFIEYDHNTYPGYGGGADNYYNNGEYVTGISYFNRSVGSPLLLSPEYNTNGQLGFHHNRIMAWHLGVEGDLADNLSYRLLCSDIKSFGTAYRPTLKQLHSLSFSTTVSYLRDSWAFSVTLAADQGDLLGKHFGFGFSITKTGIVRGQKVHIR